MNGIGHHFGQSAALFAGLVAIPLWTALALDADGVLFMFGMDVEQLPAHWRDWVRKVFGKKAKRDEGPRVLATLRLYNWLASIIFLVTAVQLLSALRRGEQLISMPLRCFLACVSMLYLLGFFGVSLVYAHVAEGNMGATVAVREEERASGIVHVLCAVIYGVCAAVPLVGVYYLVREYGSDVWEVFRGLGTEGGAERALEGGAGALWIAGTVVFASAWIWERYSRERLLAEAMYASHPATREREEERLRSYPRGYANGWYRLTDLKSLGRGEVKSVEVMGLALVVVRSRDGLRVSVFDAYCPHLGAHLGEGGRVAANGDLECPFHKWRFDADGKAACVPYYDGDAPRTARLRKWPSRLWMGQVVFYYDRDEAHRAKSGLPPQPPTVGETALPSGASEADCVRPPYDPPALSDRAWEYMGSYDPGRELNMSLQEFAENSADTRHFDCIHDQMTLPWTSIPIPGIRIQHTPGWSRDAADQHSAKFTDHAVIQACGRLLPWSSADAEITFVGPGGLALFRFDIPRVGQILLLQTHTPSAPLRLKATFHYWAEPSVPFLLAWYVVGNWISQWSNDIRIWENKIFRHKPVLVKGDGPVMAMRKWLRQFYADGQPKRNIETQEKQQTSPTILGCAKATAGTTAW